MKRGVLAIWLSAAALCLAGCAEPAQREPAWEPIPIGELAPAGDQGPTALLKSISLDVHIMEVPADNIEELRPLWAMLSAEPLRLTSYRAFVGNSFRVRFGRVETWPQLVDAVTAAGGQRAWTTALLLADGESSDVPAAQVPIRRQISFVGADGHRQTTTLGPGVLGLRVRAEKVPETRGLCKIVAFPVFDVPVSSSIPALRERLRTQEVLFYPAAFGLNMKSGDVVVLGPEKYSGLTSTLGGSFFDRPEGSVFFDPASREPPQRKESFRVFILVCRRVSG